MMTKNYFKWRLPFVLLYSVYGSAKLLCYLLR